MLSQGWSRRHGSLLDEDAQGWVISHCLKCKLRLTQTYFDPALNYFGRELSVAMGRCGDWLNFEGHCRAASNGLGLGLVPCELWTAQGPSKAPTQFDPWNECEFRNDVAYPKYAVQPEFSVCLVHSREEDGGRVCLVCCVCLMMCFFRYRNLPCREQMMWLAITQERGSQC